MLLMFAMVFAIDYEIKIQKFCNKSRYSYSTVAWPSVKVLGSGLILVQTSVKTTFDDAQANLCCNYNSLPSSNDNYDIVMNLGLLIIIFAYLLYNNSESNRRMRTIVADYKKL